MAKHVKSTRKFTVDDLIEQHSKEIPNYEQLAEEERERMDIAQQIYDLRMEAGLTQTQLAKLVGTSTSVISRLEDTDYERHSMSLLRRIAAALGKRVRVRFVDAKFDPDIFCKPKSNSSAN